MSPLLFNLVIDLGLEAIPDTVGYSLCEARVNSLAFADDIILVVETPAGLQSSLTLFVDMLGEAGMRLNQAQCATLTMVLSGKVATVKVADTVNHISGIPLPVLEVTFLWRYLGMEFVGRKSADWNSNSFTTSLDRISNAKMQSQMRLAVLRDYLIPKFLHGLTFGKCTAGRLRMIDHHTRQAVRSWLELLTSCPTLTYIHAKISAGGLGVPRLVTQVPRIRLNRHVRLENSILPAVREAFRLHGVAEL